LENKYPDIRDWKQIYNEFYCLSKKKVSVHPLRDSISPFRGWNDGPNLEWWTTYNDLKHNRFTKLENANFKTALHALGGLFLTIIIHVPNKKYLYDIGVIEYMGLLNPVVNYWCADMFLRKEPIIASGNTSIIASTSLFSYEFKKTSPSLPRPVILTGGVVR